MLETQLTPNQDQMLQVVRCSRCKLERLDDDDDRLRRAKPLPLCMQQGEKKIVDREAVNELREVDVQTRHLTKNENINPYSSFR